MFSWRDARLKHRDNFTDGPRKGTGIKKVFQPLIHLPLSHARVQGHVNGGSQNISCHFKRSLLEMSDPSASCSSLAREDVLVGLHVGRGRVQCNENPGLCVSELCSQHFISQLEKLLLT